MDPRSTCRLPDGWSGLELIEDEIVADGVEIARAGCATRAPSGEEIVGAAAEPRFSPRPPFARSYYELLERVVVIEATQCGPRPYPLRDISGQRLGERWTAELFPKSDAPDLWQYARTNGVAIQRDWTTAAARAACELVERDRVLRSWCGEIRPRRAPFDFESSLLANARRYDWRLYDFVEPSPTGFAAEVIVSLVIGFPLDLDAPLALGFGASEAVNESRQRACREALQSLAFLWGEPIATTAPPIGPTPMHHLEHFQYRPHHDILRRWLDGAHDEFGRRPQSFPNGRMVFVDLTPSWLGDGLRVAKAISTDAMALTFGSAPAFEHLPEVLRIHPIA